MEVILKLKIFVYCLMKQFSTHVVMSTHELPYALMCVHEYPKALMSMVLWCHEHSRVLMSAHSIMALCS